MESNTTSTNIPSVILLPPTPLKANHANAIVMPMFAIIAIFIAYLPLRSFYRVRNVAAVSIVICMTIKNLGTIINAFIWPNDNARTWWNGVGLCDVEVAITWPLTFALATSLCCLCKSLADVLDQDNVTVTHTRTSRRRKIRNDILFCWLPPIIMLGLHYIIQAGRYSIVPVYGCADQISNSWPTIVLLLIWCPIYALLNTYYAILMLFRLHKYRKTITQTLNSSGSGLEPRKYVKLVLIAISLLIIYLPVQILFYVRSFPPEWVPYSWSDVHSPQNWDPIIFYRTSDVPNFQYIGWTGIGMSATMFLFFGFNDEAIDTYRGWLVKLGFAKIWPSLREPRLPPGLRERSGSSSSGSTFSSHFDLVGKAMKHFDTESRKDSGGTTLINQGSGIGQSRKGSQATYDHIDMTNISKTLSNNPRKEVLTPTTTNCSIDTDTITPALPPPSFRFPRTATSTIDTDSTSQPQPSVPHRNFFSTFKTSLNLPMHLFHSPPPSSLFNVSNTILEEKTPNPDADDLEAQVFPTHESSSSDPQTSIPMTQTKVWSGTEEGEDADIDPLAPKMGTRAYRERERRELERERELEGKSVLVKTTTTQEESGGGGNGDASN